MKATRTCSLADCQAPYYSLGYCQKHYGRFSRTGDPYKTLPSGKKRTQPLECTVEGCESAPASRGWCPKHYTRWLRTGSTTKRRRRWISSGGYEHQNLPSHPTADGSGQVYTHRKVVFDQIGDGSHPCSWCGAIVTWFTREWWTELVIDHINRDKLDNRIENLVPSCNRCNSQRDREKLPTCRKGHPFDDEPLMREGHRVCRVCLQKRRDKEQAKRKRTPWPELTHCLRGHEYTPKNTYVTPKGKKQCRTCRRARDRGEFS